VEKAGRERRRERRLKDRVSMANHANKYDVFLSYRRDGGETMAILLRDRLSAKGYRVFLDIESLNSGSFNEKLLSVIEECTDIIVVCSKNSLDRCANEGDWVRMEIAHALKHGKNVVPVLLRGFEWPDTLPGDIDALRMQNGINAGSNEYFDAAIDRLAKKFLASVPVMPPGSVPEEFEKSFAGDIPLSKKTKRVWVYFVSVAFLAVLVVGGIAFWGKAYLGSSGGGTDAAADMNSRKMFPSQETGAKTDTQATPKELSASKPPETAPQSNVPLPELSVDFITIKGERYSTSLFELDLSDRGLSNSDIIPLKHMKNLEVLKLGRNQISDLTPLSGLTSLTVLFLYDNKRISDLKPLSKLTKLTNLSLYDNRISDLSPLSNLTNLVNLALNDNQISDLSPLKNLVNLTELGLRYNQISDLKPLSDLKNLKKLSLGNNQISDWSPVAHVPGIHDW